MTVIIDGTNGITNVNGSAAAPAETGIDTDTGIYYGTNTVGLATNGTNALFVDASQNVGIGTSSPSSFGKLAVVSATNQAGIYVTDGTYAGALTPSSLGGMALVSNGAYPQIFYVNGSERMRIDSSGNVGIGTTSTSGFRIAAVGAAGANAVYKLLSASGYGSFLQMGVDGGSLFEISVNTSGNLSLTTNGVAADVVRITRAGSVSNTMTVDAGEVRVGNNTDNGAYNLQCNGTGVWGAGAYVNGSDARIKGNIAPLQSGLDTVAKLNPVTFQYKESWSKDTSTQPGFIAQELQTALADTNYVDGVVKQGEEYMSVSYQTLIPVLTKAIQELKTQNDDLRARVAALEGAA